MTSHNFKTFEAYINADDGGSHSPIGASTAHRWLNCPGSVALAAKSPRRPVSEYMLEGTRAHRCAELILSEQAESWELVGLKGVTEEMIGAAVEYARHVWGLAPGLRTLTVEHEFHLREYDERAFGTADAVVATLRDLHVVDFKYGAGVAVDVVEENGELNSQLLYYGLGALREYAADAPIKTVYIWIVQPRAEHRAGQIRGASIDVEKLKAWGEKLRQGMAATKAPDAPLAEGDWCRWCPALMSCPLKGRLVVADAVTDFAEPVRELAEPRTLTPEQVGLVLTQQGAIEDWFKAVYEHAMNELRQGRFIPGFKLVEGRSMRVWSDNAAASEYLESQIGNSAYSTKLISPAQAEKLKVKIPDGYVRKTVPNLTIAAESDKRASAKSSAISDFENV